MIIIWAINEVNLGARIYLNDEQMFKATQSYTRIVLNQVIYNKTAISTEL